MQIYNTLGRVMEPFEPRDDGQVTIYVCGPTVQARPHIGHGRAAVAFDVIRRYFIWLGYQVTYVQNVTDVEDKIIAAAAKQDRTSEEIAAESHAAFEAAYAALGVMEPSIAPRATDHVPEMIAMIEHLIATDHAYEAEGDVYFVVRSFPDYGKLSGRNIDDLCSGARINPTEHKRDVLDFALWKAAKPGEPSWDSPWGRGRPGWHIECSAMALKYLGVGFDIHAGGLDLAFPHHENEIAQAEAPTGARFANSWLHNGLVNLSGQKMAKSTGHVVDLLETVETYPPLAVRLFYLRAHYRKPVEYTDDALGDATAQLHRLWAFRRRGPLIVKAQPDGPCLDAFREKMDDDFDVAAALAVLFDVVRTVNKRLDQGLEAAPWFAAFDQIVGVLGLAEPMADLDEISADVSDLAGEYGLESDTAAELVDQLIARRQQARDERDFALSDGIRDGLARAGIAIEDTANGTRWHRG